MRNLRLGLFLFYVVSILATDGLAQTTAGACSLASGKSATLYCAPIFSTEQAYRVPAATTENFVIQSGFIPVTSAIGLQLSTLPTPTPASGLIFAFGSGGLTTERELGPIFSSAPWTVGRHKLYLAFAYQHFQFDKVDNVRLRSIPLELSACLSNTSPACGPFVQTNSSYGINLNQYIAYASFGLTSRLEISATIPIVDVRSSIKTTCSVCSQQLDYSVNGTQATMGFSSNTATGTSSGIGDVIVSVNGTVIKGEKFGLAAGIDVRTPTGDANNLRGAGTPGERPFVAFGYRSRFSPHLNAGFLINGSSILASTNGTTPSHLPNSFDYTAGTDLGLAHWLSVSADFLGKAFFNASSVAIDQTGLALHRSAEQTINTSTVAVGAKGITLKHLLITANILFPIDNNGLHYKPSPMGGISYTF